MSAHKRSRTNFENDTPPSHAPYAIYGTPLPAFDPEVRDDGSYVPVWKQEVTDERGKKRLHGAFTGGWSAGYFNTVGSKEGWAPSTFVSSRANRAKPQQQQQNAEDFMDDEDVADRAESQKLETQGAFAGLGTPNSEDNARGLFSDLFRAAGDTMGVKLLQRMGWRQGQGIGPKIKRLAQGDKIGEEHEFAPENSPMIVFSRKLDRKGLGFAGEASLQASRAQRADQADEEDDYDADARILSANRSKVVTKPKQPRKPAFGVGVLNDTGSDDEDPYAIGPQIKYNRVLGGPKSAKSRTKSQAETIQKSQVVSTKLEQRSANIGGGLRKCHDGRLALEGFVLSAKLSFMMQENAYPAPEIPADWKPAKMQDEQTLASTSFQSTADAAKASQMDAKSRATVLGEQQLPGKSVFDFLKPTARDKLVNASGRSDLPQARGEGRPEGFDPDATARTPWDRIPRIDKDTAAAVLQRGSRGWMPYAEDEAKRARYRSFLTSQAGLDQTLMERPVGFSTNEWIGEMREFAQAAEVFKPISGLMATRFTTSTAQPKIASDQSEGIPVPPTKPPDPAEEAAKAGMYGPLTRTRSAFHPTRLLCKRFGVTAHANVGPEHDGNGNGNGNMHDREGKTGTELVSKAAVSRMMSHATFTPTAGNGMERGEDGGFVAATPAVVDASFNEALEGKRPDEHVLKSIFEDQGL